MGKVVILSGSVRRGGNTETLARAFAEGAGEHHEVELISAADCKVNPCVGCNSCFKRENHACFQQDDMQMIYPKLAEADVIVAATPVYFYGISAQLKAIVDRLHTPYRNEFRVKKLVLLAVAGATLPAVFDSVKMMYRLILDYFKLEDGGMITVYGVRELGDIDGNPALDEAYRLGKRI